MRMSVLMRQMSKVPINAHFPPSQLHALSHTGRGAALNTQLVLAILFLYQLTLTNVPFFSFTEEGRFEVTEDVTARGLRHTLMVHKAQAKDFGPYNCSVQNAYGSDVFEIILNKKSESLFLTFIIHINSYTGDTMLMTSKKSCKYRIRNTAPHSFLTVIL